jgi:hypothetical protein
LQNSFVGKVLPFNTASADMMNLDSFSHKI